MAGSGSGDFNLDGRVDAEDIDALCQQILRGGDNLLYDLNGDNTLDSQDFDQLIAGVLRTTPGDSNLDGRFDSADLVLVFQAGQYEDAVVGNSGWSQGDWNCDGEFTTSDLVAAFQTGSYAAQAAPGRNLNRVGAAIDAVMARWGTQEDGRRKTGLGVLRQHDGEQSTEENRFLTVSSSEERLKSARSHFWNSHRVGPRDD